MIASKQKKIIDNVLICAFIFFALSPLFSNEIRYVTLGLITLLISRGKLSRKSKLFSLSILAPMFMLLALSIIVTMVYVPPLVHWKFIFTFFFILALSIVILDTVGLEQLLKVNFYFTGYLCLATLPIFILYRFNFIDPGMFFEYEYGGYKSNTLIFLNIHMYLDGSFSGRFVGFGSEPGLSQLSWVFALYYGLINKSNRLLTFAVILAIVLGRSPIGVLFALFFLFRVYGASWLFRLTVLAIFLLSIYAAVDWYFILNQVGGNKIFESYLANRFEREIVMFSNSFDYLLPGGVYELYPPSMRDDFLGFGGASQLIMRFGFIVTIIFISSPFIQNFPKMNILLVTFLIFELLTQSVFLNPLFYCLWFGIFYYDSDISRV